MFSFIRKRLEVKITLALAVAIACMIGIAAFSDIENIRMDALRTSERTLGAFAGAIKGSVVASMTGGHHEDVRRILKEINTPYFISRVMIYDESGRPLQGVEKLRDYETLDIGLPPGIITSVEKGDISTITEHDDQHFISYYSPIENRQECFRCHGDGQVLNGILRVDFSLEDLDDLIASRKNRVLVWSLQIIVLLTIVLVVVLRIVVHRPVRQLRDAMAGAESGITPGALSTSGEDELADLKMSFVRMVDRMKALHEANLEKEKEIAHGREVIRFRNELQTMFNAMPDGILLIGADMKIIQSNPRAAELVPGMEPVGGYLRPDCDRKECCPFQTVQEVLSQGKTTSSQCSISLPNGETRHLHSICAPVLEENGTVGHVVQVIRDITDRVRTERELEDRTAELLTANRQLSKLAVTDSLTQVHNRRYFDELLYKEIKRFNRRKYSHLSLMMVDIDHFKQLNDRYGHLTGDAILREVATMLRENVRETDTVARFGGEEFVIIMPETHLDGAAYRAEALRKKVEARSFPGPDAPIRVTISIGVAGYAAGVPHDVVRAADQALYRAKEAGRNRVVVFGDESVVKE